MQKNASLSVLKAGRKGYGLYASEQITPGDLVCEYVGIITSASSSRIAQPTLQCLESPALYIDPFECGSLSRLISRARPSSCAAVMSKRVLNGIWTPTVDIVAKRGSAVGEEITLENEQAKFIDGLAPIWKAFSIWKR